MYKTKRRSGKVSRKSSKSKSNKSKSNRSKKSSSKKRSSKKGKKSKSKQTFSIPKLISLINRRRPPTINRNIRTIEIPITEIKTEPDFRQELINRNQLVSYTKPYENPENQQETEQLKKCQNYYNQVWNDDPKMIEKNFRKWSLSNHPDRADEQCKNDDVCIRNKNENFSSMKNCIDYFKDDQNKFEKIKQLYLKQ